jgi:hypothetical protein
MPGNDPEQGLSGISSTAPFVIAARHITPIHRRRSRALFPAGPAASRCSANKALLLSELASAPTRA